MNKLLVFPLILVAMMSFMYMAFASTAIDGISLDNSSFNKNSSDFGNAVIQFVGGSTAVSVTTIVAIIAIFITASVVAALLGLGILGSGFSPYSQRVVFNVIIFGGLWFVFSAILQQPIFGNAVFGIFFLLLTVIYVIGLGLHVGGANLGE